MSGTRSELWGLSERDTEGVGTQNPMRGHNCKPRGWDLWDRVRSGGTQWCKTLGLTGMVALACLGGPSLPAMNKHTLPTASQASPTPAYMGSAETEAERFTWEELPEPLWVSLK